MLVKMQSGKIGRYKLYSVIRTSISGNYEAVGELLGYKTLAQEAERAKTQRTVAQIQASALAGSRSSRFDSAGGWI